MLVGIMVTSQSLPSTNEAYIKTSFEMIEKDLCTKQPYKVTSLTLMHAHMILPSLE